MDDARRVSPSSQRLDDINSRVIAVQLPDNTIALHIPKDITDGEIDDLIRQVMPKVMKSQLGCVCGIYGYNHDERELYEIPEAIELAKRLVERGFISMAHTSTLMDQEEKPHLRRMFGAFEIWSMATGHFSRDGDLDIDEPARNRFLLDLDKANKKAADLCNPKITDGQHRTKIT